MATVTPRSASREGVESLTVREWVAGDEEASHSDRYLAARLAAATADYKGVALTTFLLGAGVGVLVWLGIGILAEHWLVAGGLPRWLRWTWLACGFAALAAAAVRWLVPLVRYRVNLVYAARQIEREHPELHNDLVNTVLVKARPDASPAVVVTSLKRRTARRLADVAGSATMDRTHAVRLAYALLAAVGLACLYEVIAPKSLLVSAARLVAPWIGWAAPSRVRIDGPRLAWRLPDQADAAAGADARRRVAIDGGKAVVIRGRQLEVTAAIRGLRAGEQPVCRVTPLTDAGGIDPQATPWQVVMHSGPDADPSGRLFTALLPDAGRGLDRSLDVSIIGGDAHTEAVRVTVVDAPSLLVREVRYDFPAYTKRPPETVAWQGDLRAVEETLATLTVEANQPLEAAWVDFRGDGQRDLKIKLSGAGNRQGTVSFPLRLNAERMAAEHPTYRLVFQGAGEAGGRDGVVQDSLVHRIEVVADLAPEIAIEEPTDSPRRVPPGSPVPVRVRASDPDFGLARVGIETRIKGGGHVTPVVLLDETREGVFKGGARLVPDKLGAGAGSVLEYRGFAIDTRPQQTNVAHTPWQELQIDAAAKPPAQPADQPGIPDEPRRGGDRQERGDRDGGAGRDNGAPRDRAPREGNGRDGEAHDAGADDAQPGDPPDAGGKNGDRGGPTERTEREMNRDRQQDPGRGQRRDGEPGREPQDQPADQPGESGGGEGQQAGDRGAGEGKGQQPNQGRDQQGGRGGRQGQPRDGQDGGRSTESDNATGDDAGSSAGAADGGAGERQQRQGGGNRSDGARDGGAGESSDAAPGGESGDGTPGDADSHDDGRTPGGGRERSGAGRGRGRVAADGTDDGEAMERILADRQRTDGDGDGAEGSRAGGERPGSRAEDRGGANQRRPDDSGRPRDGEAPRQGDSGESSTTDGGEAGGERGRQGGQDGERDQGTRDDARPPRGRDGGKAGNEPKTGAGQKNGAGQQAEGDRQPGDQGMDRNPGGKENGAGPEGDDTGHPGRSSEGGERDDGREQQGPGGRDNAPQQSDDQDSGTGGPGKRGAGEPRGSEKGGSEKGGGEKGGGEKGGGEKGGGEEAGGEKGGGEKGGGEKGGGEKGGGEKGGGEKGGGEKGGGEKGGGEKGGGEKGGGEKGGGEKGGGEKGGGEKGGGEKGGGEKGGGEKGGGGQNGGGASGGGGPAQGAPGEKEPSGSEPGSDQPKPGQQQGDRGADEPADTAGGGDKPAGGPKPAAGEGGRSGNKAGAPGQSGAASADGGPPAEGAEPGPQQDGNSGDGGWARSDGAADPQRGAVDGAAPTAETEWGQQDVDHARNAADLAIEHLRRSMEKGDGSVLDSLGWTKDDARAFLDRWQALKQQAEAGDPVKRREFERTLRSLGLRGGNVRSRRDVPADVKGGQAEGRRSRPPSEYRERFKAYTQGTTSE